MSKKYAEINIKECIGCGACVKKCKKGALSMGPDGFPVVDRALCTGCGKCMKARPADCIEIIKEKKSKEEKKEKKKDKEKKDKKEKKEKIIAASGTQWGNYLAPVYVSAYERQMISTGQHLD